MTTWRIGEATAFVVSSPERVVVYNLDLPRTQPMALLGSGAAIWRAMIGPDDDLRPWHEEDGLVTALAEAYGVPSAQISPDVVTFLAKMADGGYVERA